MVDCKLAEESRGETHYSPRVFKNGQGPWALNTSAQSALPGRPASRRSTPLVSRKRRPRIQIDVGIYRKAIRYVASVTVPGDGRSVTVTRSFPLTADIDEMKAWRADEREKATLRLQPDVGAADASLRRSSL